MTEQEWRDHRDTKRVYSPDGPLFLQAWDDEGVIANVETLPGMEGQPEGNVIKLPVKKVAPQLTRPEARPYWS